MNFLNLTVENPDSAVVIEQIGINLVRIKSKTKIFHHKDLAIADGTALFNINDLALLHQKIGTMLKQMRGRDDVGVDKVLGSEGNS